MNTKIKVNFLSNNKLKLQPRIEKSNCYVSSERYVSSELLRFKWTVTFQLNCYVSSELLRFKWTVTYYANVIFQVNCYVTCELLHSDVKTWTVLFY